MEKKYSLTSGSKRDGHIVYRIIAEKDFFDIKRGTFGGFIESENNLSHEGNCWVYDNASIYDDARVYDNARVYGNARICDNARVYDDAVVSDNAIVCEYAKIYDNARVCNDAQIFNDAKVYNYAAVGCNAKIYDNAIIYGNAMVYGNAKVYGNAQVYDNAQVYGNAKIYDYGSVSESMWINCANVNCSLINNILENIRCQTGLIVADNRVIAYKQVNKDMSSFYDRNFKYEVGKVIEVKDAKISNESCTRGLHFSNANYWNDVVGADTGYLIAEIDINDIITVQQGKIRCKKAKILGTYNI